MDEDNAFTAWGGFFEMLDEVAEGTAHTFLM